MDFPDVSKFPKYLFVNILDITPEILEVKQCFRSDYLDQLLLEIVQCATMSSGFSDNLDQLCENYAYLLKDEQPLVFDKVGSLIIHLGDYLIELFKQLKTYSEDDVCYYRLEEVTGNTLLCLKRVDPSEHYCNLY